MSLLKWVLFLQLSAFAVPQPAQDQLAGCEKRLKVQAEAQTQPEVIKPLSYRLLNTPSQLMSVLSTLGDRLLVRLNHYSEFNIQWLSPTGQQQFRNFMKTVDPMRTLSELAAKFGVAENEAQQMLFVDGESLIQSMFKARNEQNWNEVIRIYDESLKGDWQNVTEAKLQVALALNRRHQGSDRARALQYTDEVITASRGKTILSEAYGIRARIFKDRYEETKDAADLNESIRLYMLGFHSNPTDYYPGIAGINMLVYKGDKESLRLANAYAEQVQKAVDQALARYKIKKQVPDYWLVSTAVRLYVMRGQWEKVNTMLPEMISLSEGPQNLQSSLDDWKKVYKSWSNDSSKTRMDQKMLRGLIYILNMALKRTDFSMPLTEKSLSYIGHNNFPDMESAFGTDAVLMQEEITKSGVEKDLYEAAKHGDVHVMSFHKFLQSLKPQPDEDTNGILLAPTGPYREVMQAIADQAGLTPWWKAYPMLGMELSSIHAKEFLQKVKAKGLPIYFLIPRNFAEPGQHKHTREEFDLVLSMFKEFAPKTHFVFGFEQTFPLDYKNRLTPEQVRATYTDTIVRIFLAKEKKWLEAKGPKVPEYKFKTDFQSSLYPLVYDEVLTRLTSHQASRQLHSENMPRGQVHLLDLGGGTGIVARKLEQDDPKRFVELFDSSSIMLERAKMAGMPSARVHNSDITKLVRTNNTPVTSESIDGAISSNVLYLLGPNAVEGFFKEAHRVLKKGAPLSISSMLETTPEAHADFLKSVYEETKKMEVAGRVPPGSTEILASANNKLVQQSPTLFSFSRIVEVAKSHGFSVVKQPQFVYGEAGFFVVFKKD